VLSKDLLVQVSVAVEYARRHARWPRLLEAALLHLRPRRTQLLRDVHHLHDRQQQPRTGQSVDILSGQSVVSQWSVLGQSLVSQWSVIGQLLVSQWSVTGQSVVSPWSVSGQRRAGHWSTSTADTRQSAVVKLSQ